MLLLRLMFSSSPVLLSLASTAAALAGLGNLLLLDTFSKLGAGPIMQDRITWVLFALLGVLCVVASSASALLLSQLNKKILTALHARLSALVVRARVLEIERVGLSKAIAAFTVELQRVADGAAATPQLLVQTCIFVGCLVLVAQESVPVFAACVVLSFGGALFFAGTVKAAARTLGTLRTRMERVVADAQFLVRRHKQLVQDTERGKLFLKRNMEASAASALESSARADRHFVVNNAVNHSIFLMVLAASVVFQKWPLDASIESDNSITLIVAFAVAALAMLVGALPHVTAADEALRALEDLERGVARVADADGQPMGTPRHLHLQALWFAYPGATFEVGPIDLTLKRGEMVVISGGNGSGKTTLAKMVCGLYETEKGRVVDAYGHRLDARTSAYRGLFGSVWQDTYMPASMDIGWLQIPTARLLNEMILMELGGNVLVGNLLHAEHLSAGEMARLNLALTFAQDKPFYVLDEPTANLDARFRQRFYSGILPAKTLGGAGILLITHDVEATTQTCRHLYMRDGLIKESP